MNAFWIILTGLLIAANGAMLGSWMLVRRQSMMIDAISHAVLPGIVLAFLWMGERNSATMLPAAALSGIVATALISRLSKRMRLPSEAAIGLVYTLFFSVGIILVSQFAANVDLDLDCVLFGEIAYVPLDRFTLVSGFDLGPKSTWILAVVLLITLPVLLLLHRHLLITSFDEGYAQSIGYQTSAWDLLLMSLVSLSTVASFESVGSVLVLTFFSVPAATAFLFTRQMKPMMMLAVLLGAIAVVVGYFAAYRFNASIAPAMAVASGILFFAGVAVHLLLLRLRQMNIESPVQP